MLKTVEQKSRQRKAKLTQELKSITNQLIELYSPEKIILFGSLVNGESVHNNSDIDLFIIKQNVPKKRGYRTYELDKLIDYSLAVDFIVYTPEEVSKRLEIGDLFVTDIINNGKLIYEQKA
ncbi:MAG: nucleotidyltransferase domain-containing protein [Spirochaetia bacterium]|nr:nucleotidyltransferase domain-containing protein [Spirochaetia bacterium]